MNKALLSLAAGLLLAFAAHAQDEGVKLAKSAGKAYASYNLDQVGNADKLAEAKEKIDKAMQLPDAQASVTAWQTRGDVYSTIVDKDVAKMTINPQAKFTGENDALVAFEAYQKAYTLATKKYEKQDAIKGLAGNIETALLNIGGQKYEASNFEGAFRSFKAALDCHNILKENKEKSYLDNQEQYDNYVHYASFCAIKAGKHADAKPLLDAQVKTGKSKAEIYQDLYEVQTAMNDAAGAEATLTEGRTKWPDDNGLLFTEINVYLKKGRLSELTGRLEKAISVEPNNPSLYTTLGSIYDNLYQKSLEAKNEADGAKYLDLAKKNYESALKIDPKNVDATYQMGALFFNKAAIMTKEILAMPDATSADLNKIEAKQKELMVLFDQALPFFQKAESLDPNDQNTLIALKEIYTRKEDDLALEFKKRLDTVTAGGKNAASHFTAEMLSSGSNTIQMKKTAAGTYEIPCKVNGLDQKFFLDTGASTVSISIVEAKYMAKQGLLKPEDIKGSTVASIANGDLIEGTKIVIREIVIGGMYTLKNIEANVVHSDTAPLLLGQNALEQLGKITIDPKTSTLTINQ